MTLELGWNEDRLLRAYARGERSAFTKLYEEYKTPVYHYLVKSCSNRADADELFQEVWLRVIASASSFEAHGRFRSWLFSVAHNCVVDHYRRAGRATLVEVTDDMASEAPTPDLNEGERIERAIRRLPFEQRQAFYLREILGCSVKQIAEIQDIGVEAAKSRLRYAYGKLREDLEGEDR